MGLAAWIGAIFYPLFIGLFPLAMTSYRETGNPLFAAGAAVMMLCAGSVSLLAGTELARGGDRGDAGSIRIMLCLIFAVAPLYVLSGLLSWASGLGPYHRILWCAVWIAAGMSAYFQERMQIVTPARTASNWLRVLHGGVALCLLCGFLIAHLFNHDLALWNVPLHAVVLKILRQWYRARWVEPLLLTLLLLMAATGLPMVRHFAGRKLDAFRAIQMATGVYIGVFLCSHLMAVLGARRAGTETGWIFAAGRAGLLHGDGMLIPYYILAVFFLILHCGCGLRIVLLKHGTTQATADHAVHWAAAAGLVATMPIAAAILGYHVH